jgi:hypothetical protein
MPANKPVKKGTNQTEKKAKGLLANVGDYEGKTLNLTKKQLGKSGQAAASSRRVAISRTTYDKATKKVLGPMGKPLTGRVDLGGGNIAVYKNGVRVRAAKPDTGSKGGGGGGGAGGRGAKQGKPYEERKAAIGAKSGRPAVAGSVGARQGKFGSMTLPGGGGRIARPKGAAAKPDPMDAPYRAGKTKPMPGMTAQERRINASKTARQYPSRRVVEAQERRLQEALIAGSLLPGVGIPIRAISYGAKVAAAGNAAAAGARQGLSSLGRGAAAKAASKAASKAGTKAPPKSPPRSPVAPSTPTRVEGPKRGVTTPTPTKSSSTTPPSNKAASGKKATQGRKPQPTSYNPASRSSRRSR